MKNQVKTSILITFHNNFLAYYTIFFTYYIIFLVYYTTFTINLFTMPNLQIRICTLYLYLPTYEANSIIKRHFRQKRPFLSNFIFFKIFIPNMSSYIILSATISYLFCNLYPVHPLYVSHTEDEAGLSIFNIFDPLLYCLYL